LKEICIGLDEILMQMGGFLMPSCRWQLFDDDHNLGGVRWLIYLVACFFSFFGLRPLPWSGLARS
jgi:hypothetical protein